MKKGKLRILAYILIGLAVVIGGFLIVVAMQPDDFRVVRKTTMEAPQSVVFEQVNDFHKWTAWSPWEKLDPEMKRTYDGPAAGTGAKYAWVGNSQVGEGRMTITESRPSDLIRIQLEFLKPFESTNTTEFTFKPEGNQTLVTWDMSGKHNLFSKAMCMFMSMDKMVGGDFEKGLTAMKSVVESVPKA